MTVQRERIADVRRALHELTVDTCRDDGDSAIEVQTRGDCWDLLFVHHRMRSVRGVRKVALLAAIDEGDGQECAEA